MVRLVRPKLDIMGVANAPDVRYLASAGDYAYNRNCVRDSKVVTLSTRRRASNSENLTDFCTEPKERILEYLEVDPEIGIPSQRVEEQRARYGTNSLDESKPTSASKLVLEGAMEPMMVLLLSVAGISFVFGRLIEAIVMIIVVVAYILVEFANKYRSDRTMARLKELSRSTTRVIRDGREKEIPISEVVVGDLILLSPGVRIPADARLVQSTGLLVNEASLTGESHPIQKYAKADTERNSNLAETVNCVFSGTAILDGAGKAIVLAVGQQTEFGKIAEDIRSTAREPTPLQQEMKQLSKALAIFAVIVSLIIPVVGFLRGLAFEQMVLTWLALTFLMVPGQPPIIITMALALASFELARKDIVVKRLRGAEGLGSVTSVVTDKTGTITENRMKVERFVLPDGTELAPQEISKALQEKILLSIPEYTNDPTDNAVIQALDPKPHNRKSGPISLEGFSEGHPWRVVTYRDNDTYLHAIAGEPELVINTSSLLSKEREQLEQVVIREGSLGKRVVAYASSRSERRKMSKLYGIQLVALAVLEDPVRQGMEESITALKDAGIRTFIVTGDHETTTKAVAEKIGLYGEIITGDRLQEMNDDELRDSLKSIRIFAHIMPSQKLRLVRLLQAENEHVAVIGDGINDAPAINSANIGIAMGEIGTDIAKEAADLVLADDNYVHIRDAVAIGRKAIENFRKGLTYYLSAKVILLSIFVIPLALGIPFPLAPIHIIIIELLMDLASSTIFVTETAESNILKRAPQRMSGYLKGPILREIFRNSIGLSLGILVLYLSLYYTTGDVTLAQTTALVTWLLGHILLALNLKQEREPLLKQGFFSNRFGTLWLISMAALSLAITSIHPVFPYFSTVSLPLEVWLGILFVIIISTFWLEILKWIQLQREVH